MFLPNIVWNMDTKVGLIFSSLLTVEKVQRLERKGKPSVYVLNVASELVIKFEDALPINDEAKILRKGIRFLAACNVLGVRTMAFLGDEVPDIYLLPPGWESSENLAKRYGLHRNRSLRSFQVALCEF